MKKTNYLFAIIATVLALGVMSCGDTENEPQPVNPNEEGIQFADFDGQWLNVTTEYNGGTYDASTICDKLTSITWQRTDFNFRSVDGAIDFVDVCRSFPRELGCNF